MKVLIVEDELDLLDSIAEGLTLLGYVTDKASNGDDAIDMAFVESYDLIILDVNLPGKDGFEVLKAIRKDNKEVAIIMLTARSDIEDRVKGLDLGASDYMVKPFALRELDARMRSHLRGKKIHQATEINISGLCFDTIKREASFNGEIISLTIKETGILEYLFLNSERFISAEELIEHVWDSNADGFSNTVRVHMSSLRKKLRSACGKNLIENVIGKGYRIHETESIWFGSFQADFGCCGDFYNHAPSHYVPNQSQAGHGNWRGNRGYKCKYGEYGQVHGPLCWHN